MNADKRGLKQNSLRFSYPCLSAFIGG